MSKITNQQLMDKLVEQQQYLETCWYHVYFNQRVLRRLAEISGVSDDKFNQFIKDTRKIVQDEVSGHRMLDSFLN